MPQSHVIHANNFHGVNRAQESQDNPAFSAKGKG